MIMQFFFQVLKSTAIGGRGVILSSSGRSASSSPSPHPHVLEVRPDILIFIIQGYAKNKLRCLQGD